MRGASLLSVGCWVLSIGFDAAFVVSAVSWRRVFEVSCLAPAPAVALADVFDGGTLRNANDRCRPRAKKKPVFEFECSLNLTCHSPWKETSKGTVA